MKFRFIAMTFALSFSAVSQADVLKCTSTHLGQPDDLTVYIQRDSSLGSRNVVLGRSNVTAEQPLVIAHFRSDNDEIGFDVDNGVQLKVAGRPEKREEADGASARRELFGKEFDQIQDLHIYWPREMQRAQAFSTQIRADMKKLESTAEPRANTLKCTVVQRSNFKNPKDLHKFAEADLGVK